MKRYMIWFNMVIFQVSESAEVAHEEGKCVPMILRSYDIPWAFLTTDLELGSELRKAFHS